METDEHSLDLYWHALNFRTVSAECADAVWLELQACVERIVQARMEREDEQRRFERFTHE
jgi:hypothetical protein